MNNKKLIRYAALIMAALMTFLALASCGGNTDKDQPVSTDAIESTDTEAPALTATVNSVPLDKFVIVYALDDDRGKTDSPLDEDIKRNNDDQTSIVYAENLKKAILETTGHELEIKNANDEESEYEILIGNIVRPVIDEYYNAQYSNVARYRIDISDKKIALLSVDELGKKAAVEAFTEKFFSSKQTSLNITSDDSFDGDVLDAKEIAIKKRINETDIRIAGNNIFFHERNNAALYSRRTLPLLQSFSLMDADVLMLQECGYLKSKTAANKTWHDILDPLLPTLGYTQVPITLDPAAKENYTPIWYRADKFELVESEYNLYESVKEEPDSYLSDSKSYTMAIFKVKGTDDQFACFSTHFTYAGDPTLANKLRVSDANEVAAAVDALRAKYGNDLPIILMGDLNCGTSAQPYNIVSRKLKNAKNYAGVTKNNVDYGTTHELGVYPQKGGGIIDHTMISGKGFKPVQYQHVVNDWSVNSTDHIPLVLDIAFE